MSMPVPAVNCTLTDFGVVSSRVGMYPVSHTGNMDLGTHVPIPALLRQTGEQALFNHFAEDHVVFEIDFVSLLAQKRRDLAPMADTVDDAMQQQFPRRCRELSHGGALVLVGS